MIKLLSDIGRAVIVVAAVMTVLGSTISGYLIARTQESFVYGNFTISHGGQITPRELLYSLLGGGIGLVVAGAVFGAIATLYDIRDSLHLLSSPERETPDRKGLPCNRVVSLTSAKYSCTMTARMARQRVNTAVGPWGSGRLPLDVRR